jgi:5-formyltetrahydrofolate cyclo-ligase
MAFDTAGRRVGFGGGFYDRTFSGRSGQPPLIGICFDFQVVPRCPTAAQDVGVDWLVTESRVLRCEPPR